MTARNAAILLLVVVATGGCSIQNLEVKTAVPATTPAVATSTAGSATASSPTAVAATSTPSGPTTYHIDDTVTVRQGGIDWAQITVSDVKSAASYKGPYGYVQKPQTPGYVFIAAKVTYLALQDGVSYSNLFDWQVFCDGVAVDTSRILADATYGPAPALGSGNLPNGRKASGYLVYEVPAEGEVRMSYTGGIMSTGVVFEIIIRAA
jgi:hypothetical protein